MRVLVIGGNRFMGKVLVEDLVRDGHGVTTLCRSGKAPEGASALQGDRRERGTVTKAIADVAPDLVIDMVCMTEADAAELTDSASCPFLVASSCDVYRNFGLAQEIETGEPDVTPLTEESPLRTVRYPYRGTPRSVELPWLNDYDKILVEALVQEAGGVVVRLPMVFGPDDYQHRLFEYARRMRDGRPAVLLSTAQAGWKGCRGFVTDMAHGLKLAALGGGAKGQVYNLAYEGGLEEQQWVTAIGRAMGWQGRVVTLPSSEMPEHLKEESDLSVDVSVSAAKARSEFGYAETISFEEALARTVAWELANPPAKSNEPDYAAEDRALAGVA
ncbi:MAG: NAD-dependent epimerase/dehydratase family protein [Armatimonadetes bacterium]|nr:NAD-dependent epimerase/dehydratase family protein [Armatimonadota bacterium]